MHIHVAIWLAAQGSSDILQNRSVSPTFTSSCPQAANALNEDLRDAGVLIRGPARRSNLAYSDDWLRALAALLPRSFQLAVRPRPGPGMATVEGSALITHGESMAKFNYHQARKQKEVARKARQQEKQQRRSARASTPDGQNQHTTAPELGQARAPSPESGT
jgi:hypothetical protein